MEWTLGTIVLVGIAVFILFPLLCSFIGITLDAGEDFIHEPTNEALRALYGPVHTMYTYLKAILTNKYAVAILIILSLIAMALELEWEKRKI